MGASWPIYSNIYCSCRTLPTLTHYTQISNFSHSFPRKKNFEVWKLAMGILKRNDMSRRSCNWRSHILNKFRKKIEFSKLSINADFTYGIFLTILHIAWLNNHALTLKRNTTKYYFGEKSSFLHTFLKICCESRKI